MRIVQPTGTKGSLKWIQKAVRDAPDVLQPAGLPPIEWLSPLAEDDYAEYRDAGFLQRLEIGHLAAGLQDFWPSHGPQWDALGVTSSGPVLVEAKAHIREFLSPPCKASPLSRAQIERAFASVGSDLGVGTTATWPKIYYQYANRISFLWWLRQQGIDAKLLFVSFLNDDDMNGPAHAETWETAFAAADYALGIPERNKLRRHIFHVTPDVRDQLSH